MKWSDAMNNDFENDIISEEKSKLERALEEADYILKNPNKYKGYNDIDALFEDLDSED